MYSQVARGAASEPTWDVTTLSADGGRLAAWTSRVGNEERKSEIKNKTKENLARSNHTHTHTATVERGKNSSKPAV